MIGGPPHGRRRGSERSGGGQALARSGAGDPPARSGGGDAAARRRRLTLGALAVVALLGGLALSLGAARRATEAARRDLLRAEAETAAWLGRVEGTAAVDRAFAGRWSVDADTAAVPAGSSVRSGPAGLHGSATLYDEASWNREGTLHLEEPAGRAAGVRAGGVLAIGLGALALVIVAFGWTGLLGAGRGVGGASWGAGAAAVLLLTTAVPGSRARDELARLTDRRVAVAVEALGIADLDSILARPGGVRRATGLSFLVRAGPTTDAFSTLPPKPTQELSRVPVPAPARTTADQVTYAVADLGPVRLVMVPYEHSEDPRPRMALWVLVALGGAGLCAFLAALAADRKTFRRHVTALGFLAPALLHLAVFTIGPLAFAAWLSLHRWSLIDVARPFVGLGHYLTILGDSGFWNAIWNTAVFTLHVPVAMAVALALALLVQRRIRGVLALRTVLFLPTITSLVAVAIVWQWMFNDQYGLINAFLSLFGLGPVPWLTSTATALPSLMLMSVWLVVGYQMVLFQAGLAAIPKELYEAARIDGAGPFRRFLHVTLPGLRHTLFFVLVTSVIGSFQIFGAVYVMTEGGPLDSTDVAVYHIYREAWEFLRFGSASAMSWVLFAIVFVVTWLHFRTLERRVEASA